MMALCCLNTYKITPFLTSGTVSPTLLNHILLSSIQLGKLQFWTIGVRCPSFTSTCLCLWAYIYIYILFSDESIHIHCSYFLPLKELIFIPCFQTLMCNVAKQSDCLDHKVFMTFVLASAVRNKEQNKVASYQKSSVLFSIQNTWYLLKYECMNFYLTLAQNVNWST